MCLRPSFPLLILCWDMYCAWLSCADSLLRRVLYLALTCLFSAEACTFIGNPLNIRCWDVYYSWFASADYLLISVLYLAYLCWFPAEMYCIFGFLLLLFIRYLQNFINTVIRTELKLNVLFLQRIAVWIITELVSQRKS
jgi:hypothetical protein